MRAQLKLVRTVTTAATALGVGLSGVATATAAGAAGDSTAPVASLSATAGTGYEYVAGTQIYYNDGATGRLTVTVNASDPQSGIRSVVFPDLGDGWTGGGTDTVAPYVMTYAHAIGAAAPLSRRAVVTNGAGLTTGAAFRVVADGTAPSASNVQHDTGNSDATAVPVTVRAGGDWGSGLDESWLERATASGADVECGSSGAWTRIGTESPSSPFVDTDIDDITCYSYRYVQVDRVGNRTVTPGPGALRVARLLAPSGALLPGTSRFAQSGITGGGVQTVTAFDPFGSGLVLSGGDVSGVARSTDRGVTWKLSNDGLATLGSLRISALTFSPTQRNKVYAATGRNGAEGGLYVSTDGGQSWTLRSSVPQFHADNTPVPGAPAAGTRSVGRLLEIDPSGVLYAATYDDGVMRSTDDGYTWTTLGLAGSYLRSLAIDPQDPAIVYAGTYGEGLWRSTDARGAGTFTRLQNAPVTPEELLTIGPALYVVGGTDGVWRSMDDGQTYTRLGVGSVSTSTEWISLDGYRDAATGKDVLYIGSLRPGATRASVMKSTDSGVTFRSVTTDRTRMHSTVGGPDGEEWWMLEDKPSAMLGSSGDMVLSVTVDRNNPQNVLATTWHGTFGSTDAGGNWYPYNGGLGTTVNPTVVVDPKAAGRVYVGNMDWTLVGSTDGLTTVRKITPPGAASTGTAVALDSAVAGPVSTVYVATAHRDDNVRGEIYRSADPMSGAPWVSEGLAAATGGNRPLGLTVGRQDGEVVLVAAVEESGVWRKVGAGPWTRSATPAMTTPQRSLHASLSWPAGSDTVYLFDRESGVFRSTDAGATFTRIWAKTSSGAGGFLVASAARPDQLFVSLSSAGLFRLDGAQTGVVGAGITPIELGFFAKPGALTIDPAGRVLMSSPPSVSGPARLYRSADFGARWSVLDDSLFRGGVGWASGMAAGADGRVYVSTQGTGTLVGSGY